MIDERVMRILEKNNEEIIGYQGHSMLEDGIIDSFEIIGIIANLEDEFDIEIDAKYVVEKNFATKDTIIKLIHFLIGEENL